MKYIGKKKIKNATRKVIKYFPSLKDKVEFYNDKELAEKELVNLNEVKAVFLRLIWFFENPDEQDFSIQYLYKHLNNDWLRLALEVITEYFEEDTYLLINEKKSNTSLIKEDKVKDLLSMKEVSELLMSCGYNYYPQKIATYLKRNKFVEPDVIISNIKYWKPHTIDKFMKNLEVLEIVKRNNLIKEGTLVLIVSGEFSNKKGIVRDNQLPVLWIELLENQQIINVAFSDLKIVEEQ